MSEPEVSVVVLLSADAARARRCLDAIAAGARPVAIELVLVLNAAETDVAALAHATAGARVVTSDVDLGAVGAWRVGIAAASAPRVAIVHEDAAPRPGWLAPLVAAMDADPAVAVAGSAIVDPDGTPQGAGVRLDVDGRPTRLVAPAQPAPVDYVASCSLLADRVFLREHDLPDERFFPAVYVDADIGTTAWAAARSVAVVPESVCVHERHAMIRTGADKRLPEFLFARNRERFLGKWAAQLETRPAPAERPTRAAPRAAAPAPQPPGPVPRAVQDHYAALRAETDAGYTAYLAERLEEQVAILDARERERDTAVTHAAGLRAELTRVHADYAELRAAYDGRCTSTAASDPSTRHDRRTPSGSTTRQRWKWLRFTRD